MLKRRSAILYYGLFICVIYLLFIKRTRPTMGAESEIAMTTSTHSSDHGVAVEDTSRLNKTTVTQDKVHILPDVSIETTRQLLHQFMDSF
ncbi:hypothetical protein ScPMuIL_000174 [Solemya velum]